MAFTITRVQYIERYSCHLMWCIVAYLNIIIVKLRARNCICINKQGPNDQIPSNDTWHHSDFNSIHLLTDRWNVLINWPKINRFIASSLFVTISWVLVIYLYPFNHPIAPSRVDTWILITLGPRKCKEVYPFQVKEIRSFRWNDSIPLTLSKHL